MYTKKINKISKGLIFSYSSAILLMVSCQKNRNTSNETHKIVVAQVDNTKLYQSELNTVIHPSINRSDSTALADAYIDQWVRDQLIMKEAAKYSSQDGEIEKLVRDYRQKLIRFNFENKIISERFDTIVSDKEMTEFYEKRKEQFVLKEALFLIDLVKVPTSTKKLSTIYTNWSNDRPLLNVSIDSTFQALVEKRWYTWAQIEQITQKFNKTKAQRPSSQRIKEGEYEYFLKVIEYRGSKDISPLPYISEQLKQMILHQRKLELLESYKSELYNQAIEDNLIKIGDR